MISLRTNMPSLITQQNMGVSTNRLNTAIERLSTGYKINHASDNAANYSISTNMNTQLSACDVAADNIAMGMDLLTVAQDTIAGMQDRASRIHALITQARNGTYGASSLAAMTQEANALVTEIQRLYNTTEYNGISLYDRVSYIVADWLPKAGESGFIDETDPIIAGEGAGLSGACGLTSSLSPVHNGFIAEVDIDTPQVTVTDPTQLASAISSNTKIGIGNAQTLAKLSELVNSGTTCEGKTIILTEDINLSAYQEGEGWTPIGNSSKQFQGNFNGNGHKVTGLYINRPDSSAQGLFGYARGELKNVAVVDADVTGMNATGGLAGVAQGAITNSYATGSVTGNTNTGGLAGLAGAITNSYATGSVTGNGSVGGLAGGATQTITNSYATGSVTGSDYTGGLAGSATQTITNSYATGSVTGNDYTGGLAGYASGTVTNSYSTGSVTGNDYTGGLAGYARGTITNSYSTGSVTGNNSVGGLAGYADQAITNSYATGTVTGNNYTGGLAGLANNAITNSYATGSVTGNTNTGGLAGYATQTITNSYATGSVTGNNSVGGLAGSADQAITNSYATGSVTGQGQNTGGLAGSARSTITNSYATGSVTGNANTGGLVGWATRTITNSYATGSVTGNNSVGGLAGYANQAITNSYATGTVTGNNYTGGLAGLANNAITNSYATGSVTGNANTGGLAGYATQTITNSYATGSVSGTTTTGGFVGLYKGALIDTCYSGGKVSGTDSVGGFIGTIGGNDDVTVNISNSVSYAKVNGNERVGSFIGEYQRQYTEAWDFPDDDDSGEDNYTVILNLNSCTSAVLSDYSMFGGCYHYTNMDSGYENPESGEWIDTSYEKWEEITDYDLTPLLNQIEGYNLLPSDIDIQCGINGDRSCRINFDTNFSLNLNVSDLTSDSAYNSITSFLNKLSQKSTEIGAAQNRLESALESTMVQMDNLTSSLSTIRDADIAEVSSDYIRQQILQQAAATLMSTANQSPSIALQLL